MSDTKLHHTPGLTKEEEIDLEGIYNVIDMYFLGEDKAEISKDLARSIIRMSFVQGRLWQARKQIIRTNG